MSLKKILIILLSLLFLLVFAGTLIIAINNFKTYLTTQVQSQTQNTTNALSFALSQYADINDIETMSNIVNGIFETGNYEKITIQNEQGQIILSRTMKHQNIKVPSWFMSIAHIPLQPSSSVISAGLSQYGKVTLYDEDKLVYERLWITSVELFWWFLIAFIITLLLLLPAVNYLLKPLNRVKQQAEDISNRKFSIEKNLPWPKELRGIVVVMNHLSERIQSLFQEQSTLTDTLREQAYRDPLTHLGNRRYFKMQLEHMFSETEQGFSGALFLLEVNGLETLKKKNGYEAVEQYLQHIASILQTYADSHDKSLACRLSDIDFVLLQPQASPPDAANIAKDIINQITNLLSSKENLCHIHIGIAIYRESQSYSEFLSQADVALRAAQIKGDNSWYMYKQEEVNAEHQHTATEWKSKLDNIIEKKSILLFYQPIFEIKNHERVLWQYEVLMRIQDENSQILTASQFLPMSENLQIITAFDYIVIEKSLLKISTEQLSSNFTINISIQSMHEPSFFNWLLAKLEEHKHIAPQITFEVPEQCAITALDNLREFTKAVKAFGCKVSIDQFGRAFSSVHYLKNLDIDFLKIDGSFTHHINDDLENQFFIRTLTEIAHNLEIKVIALNIETENELQTLKTFAIDGYQGYLLGKPKAEISN